jgi:hypothetical protein
MQPFSSPSIAVAGRQILSSPPEDVASTQLLAVSVRYDGPSASILVALSLGLLEAVLGYDVGDEVSLPFNAETSCSENLPRFEPISLKTICLVSAVISDLRWPRWISCLSLLTPKYPVNDYHSNVVSYIRSKRENDSDGSEIFFMASYSPQRPEYLIVYYTLISAAKRRIRMNVCASCGW